MVLSRSDRKLLKKDLLKKYEYTKMVNATLKTEVKLRCRREENLVAQNKELRKFLNDYLKSLKVDGDMMVVPKKDCAHVWKEEFSPTHTKPYREICNVCGVVVINDGSYRRLDEFAMLMRKFHTEGGGV